jgi:hypothetical protein
VSHGYRYVVGERDNGRNPLPEAPAVLLRAVHVAARVSVCHGPLTLACNIRKPEKELGMAESYNLTIWNCYV